VRYSLTSLGRLLSWTIRASWRSCILALGQRFSAATGLVSCYADAMTKLATIIATMALTTAAAAQPLPVPKQGSCPAGYASGSAYCSPMRDTRRAAIVKTGTCPSGFAQSGAYCLEMRRR
jgi:hypothetical protein